MSFNTRARWRPDRRQASQGQRIPVDAGCTPRRELKATTVRVQALSINQIKFNGRNSRTHSAKQIRQVANSIVAFGFTTPLLVTEDGKLIAGDRDASRPPLPVERLVFGSHAPYFPCESAVFKLFESPLSLEQLHLLMHASARRFMG